jgi:hypothetical protein
MTATWREAAMAEFAKGGDALPPGRGDLYCRDFSHAPSDKNLSKNGFCPQKGAAFPRKTSLQKNFWSRERFR